MSKNLNKAPTQDLESQQFGLDRIRVRMGRGEGSPDAICERLRTEIKQLEHQLARLQLGTSPRRYALVDTYQSMIKTRKELLEQIEHQVLTGSNKLCS